MSDHVPTTGDNPQLCDLRSELEPLTYIIIGVIGCSSAYVLMLFVIAYHNAKRVAQIIAGQENVVENESKIPDVIVIEKDSNTPLGRQTSVASIYRTINSVAEMEKFYDKVPDNAKPSDSIRIQMPRSGRNSRHSSIFPPVLEDAEQTNQAQVGIPRINIQEIDKHGSISSIRTPSFGTIPRRNNLVRMSSQEKVNQLTRFLLLNEDVDLFKESPASTRRGSSATSSRKLSIDYLLNNILSHTSKEQESSHQTTDEETVPKSSIPSVSSTISKKKKLAKMSNEEGQFASSEANQTVKSNTTSSSSSPPPAKYIKNPKKTNMITLDTDTVTYRRQRRPGVHFGDA